MHYLIYTIAHALVYVGVWRLVEEYHVNPWLVLGVGAAAMLLFRRRGGGGNYRHRGKYRGDGTHQRRCGPKKRSDDRRESGER